MLILVFYSGLPNTYEVCSFFETFRSGLVYRIPHEYSEEEMAEKSDALFEQYALHHKKKKNCIIIQCEVYNCYYCIPYKQ